MTDVTVAPDPTEIRSALMEQGNRLNELRALPADQRPDTYRDDVRGAIDLIHHLDAELVAATHSVAPPAAPQSRGPEAAFVEISNADTRTAGQVVAEMYAEHRQGGGSATQFETVIDREMRTLLDSTIDGSGDAGYWRPVGQPIAPYLRRQRLFIRDVIATGTTGLAAVPYLRELNAATNETGATAVVEGSAKPEVVMEFEEDTAVVKKLAAWIPATTEILDDAPTLRSYIDTRLAYMLDLREEAQVINGPGTTANLKGILQFSGVQTQSAVSGDMPATIGQAIGKIENVDGFPNFVAYNPLNYWTAVTKRHSDQFDGDNAGNAPAGRSNISWGLAEVRTRSLASGKALVGDGQMGAMILDRKGTEIRVGNQHSTYFTENKVVILAEKRLALPVFAPHLFVDATVPTS